MSTREEKFDDTGDFNLTSGEIDRIIEILGRRPNRLELEIFSLLWSEHACYKNSLKWLELLPKQGAGVVVEAGKEAAGAIAIGDGLACVFKVESHNHPCAVQPRLGALTGLRVVTRDIFAMGAKPLALLNSLRFGNGESDTARWLFEEVVNGLEDFKKGFGLPVVGGETFFCEAFGSSPIVNNMAVGVVKIENLLSAVAAGEGNLIAVIGAPTGSEGTEGDMFVPGLISEDGFKGLSLDSLRDVSVEKSLYKIVQKIIEQKLAIGVQTVGGQGIVGAVAEMAARGKSGAEISTLEVPLGIHKLTSRDVLVSETWGRMLVCFQPANLDKIKELATNYDVKFGILGRVTTDGLLKLVENDEVKLQLPVEYLGFGGKAPVNNPAYKAEGLLSVNRELSTLPEPDHYPAVVKKMMGSLNVVSKKWLGKKLSKASKGDDMSSKYPSDAAIIEVDAKGKALLATMDCNPGYMVADPYTGAQIAVAEAARNVICAGGTPLAISNCLNFGSPSDPVAYGAFVLSVKGIAEASRLLGIPVISGNVSFYNQRSVEGQIVPITPTPVIGMVGLLKDAKRHTTLSFKHKGDMIFLVGTSRDDVNGSEYLRRIHNMNLTVPPFFDATEEKELHRVIAGLIDNGLVRSVHDVSNGGLFFTLLECASPLEFGFDVTTDAEIRKDAFLFGESQSRVVVSVAAEKQDLFVDYMVEQDFPFSILGHVTKGEIRVDDESYGFIDDIKRVFEHRLKDWVEGKTT